MNSLYPWLQSQWQQLQAYSEQQRIPQALIFNGPNGLGKRDMALQYSHGLLCQKPSHGLACGHCQSCHLITAETHPDFITIQPEEPGKQVGIDVMRQLNIRLALKPQYDRYRLVLITPADAMNTAAANAFLKCLEEPTERTCFVLITAYENRLPATIRSRCQRLQFKPPVAASALQWLNDQGLHEQADILLQMAQGSPLLAQHYAQAEMVAKRQELFNDWLGIATKADAILDIAEKWHKHPQLSLDNALIWMTLWVSDILKLAQQAPKANLNNPDLYSRLQSLLPKLSMRALYIYYDTLLTSRKQLQTTANKQLLLEKLLLDWWQLNH